MDVGYLVPTYNNSVNFVSGYVPTDVTVDNFVDVSEVVITFNNANNFVSTIKP